MQEFRRRRDQGEQIVSLNTSHLKSASQNTGECNSRTDSAGHLRIQANAILEQTQQVISEYRRMQF